MNVNVEDILNEAGFDFINNETGMNVVHGALQALAASTNGADPLLKAMMREGVIKRLKAAKIQSPARVADAVFGATHNDTQEQGPTELPEPDAWAEPVAGAELLDEVMQWFAQYVYAPKEALTVVTLWAALTWFVEETYFAPILALLSPTKRSGKSLCLDLMRWIVRRPNLTSGMGITTAVVFRLNEQRQPTFLIDEAEKLSGRDGNREIIGLLNKGYRRGGKVQRCREKDHAVEEFDAFGFRAVAAIGNLWDTITDRAVVVPMQRKPRTTQMKRFAGRVIESEGCVLASKICRFTEDHIDQFEDAELRVPKPEWLNDRACDNWTPLFTVAQLAGGDWPMLALDAAKALSSAVENNDRAEQLIHDARKIFTDQGWPEVIKSGELVDSLNRIESSPWGDYSKGKGISTHKLAAIFRGFEIRPHQERDGQGRITRGYWLKDLEGAFDRYPPL